MSFFFFLSFFPKLMATAAAALTVLDKVQHKSLYLPVSLLQ